MTAAQTATTNLERRMVQHAEIFAPEMRPVGERACVRTSTGVVIGGIYENRICAEDATAIHHYPAESRLYRMGHRVLAWAMPAILIGVVLALAMGWL